MPLALMWSIYVGGLEVNPGLLMAGKLLSEVVVLPFLDS